MTRIGFDAVEIGDELPPVTKEKITRQTLALFAGASNDHNPIHIDIDFARSAGVGDVFAHGMLIMAYLGQLLTNWVPQTAIRTFGVRFRAITHVGDEITCTGVVKDKYMENGEQRVMLDLQAVDQNGEVKLSGEAVVAI